MNNNQKNSWLPWIIIPLGGLLVLALSYVGYFAVFMFIETMFFANDPQAIPAGIIRNSYAAALLAIYLLLLRTKLSDLILAILLVGPLAMLIISVILRFYETLAVAVALSAAIALICLYLIYRAKKPWFYYYAVAVSVIAALAYAWPRP